MRRAPTLLLFAVLLSACADPQSVATEANSSSAGVTTTTTTSATSTPTPTPTPADANPTTAPAPTANDDDVLRDGDRVRATGRVVAVPGKPIRFCAPVAEPAIGYEPGMEPAPAYCDLGIDVVGVDMTKLNQPRSKEGATEGQATLEGTYKAGVVTVDKQGPPEYDNTPLPDNPPCPPPPGGWPTSRPQDILEPGGAENIEIAAVEKYRAAHPGVIADVAMLRPSDKQVLLLVLANRDVEAVDAALRPAYGERLCVTRAAFTPAEAERARTEIQSNLSGTGRLGIFGVGTGLSRSAQMVIVMQVVMVTEELVALRDRYAPGLVELRPWLQRF